MQFKKQDRRQVQIGKQIQHSLANFFLKHLNVAQDGLVSVTKVHIPRDLKKADVYIHQYNQTGSVEASVAHENLIEKLQSRTGLIQRHLADELKLRFCPQLSFYYDSAYEKSLAVEKLIYDMTQSGAIKKNESLD